MRVNENTYHEASVELSAKGGQLRRRAKRNFLSKKSVDFFDKLKRRGIAASFLYLLYKHRFRVLTAQRYYSATYEIGRGLTGAACEKSLHRRAGSQSNVHQPSAHGTLGVQSADNGGDTVL
jgi:hypothetical protein